MTTIRKLTGNKRLLSAARYQVDDGVETHKTPVGGGQADDDKYAGNSTEADVLWSQSRTIIELKTYNCDEETANEYVLRRPRVRLPGPTNLNGNDEKFVPKSHKTETALHNLLVSKHSLMI